MTKTKRDNIKSFLEAIEISKDDRFGYIDAIELAKKHFPYLYQTYVDEILVLSGFETS